MKDEVRDRKNDGEEAQSDQNDQGVKKLKSVRK